MKDNRLGHAIAALSLAFLTTPTQAQEIRTVTLDDAIDLALLVSPTIVTARGDLRVAEASRREYIGDWLPTLSTSSSMSTSSQSRFNEATQTTVNAGSATSYSAGISASYTIFDGFRRSATGRTTNADIVSAEATLVNQRFQIVLQTKQAFFQAVAAGELVRVAETQIERAENQLRISREQLAAGSAIRSDTLRSFVELGNARLQLLNAQTQRETATANLARLIGFDDGVRIDPAGAMGAISMIDTALVREEITTTSPTIQQVEAQARAADAQVGISRAGYFPSLSASYSQNWNGSAIGSMNNTWNARLSLSWPIFNGFTRETGVARSLASQDAARSRVEDTRRQVAAQLTAQFAALESARVRSEIATASRVAAEEDLRVQQERYRLGVSTIIELLASQVSLDQAEVDLVQSRLDFFLAKAEIEALIGREL